MINLSSGMNPAAVLFKPSASTALWTGGIQAILLQTAKAITFNPTDLVVYELFWYRDVRRDQLN